MDDIESWTPANPAPLGLAGFAMTTFVLSMCQRQHRQSRERAGRARPGARLRRDRAAARRDVGVPHRQHVRRGRVQLVRRVLDSSYWALNVFYAKDITGATPATPSACTCGRGRSSPAYMTVAALRVSGAVLLVFVLLTITFVLLGDRQRRRQRDDRRTGAATSASRPRPRRGTRRSARSSTAPSARRSCRSSR